MMRTTQRRPSTPRPARHDYGGWLDRRLGRGRWLPVFADMLAAFGPEKTLLLATVANLGRRCRPENGGWIELTPSYVKTGPLKMSRRRQEELLGELEEAGVIEVTQRGAPATRHVRLDLARLEEAIAWGDDHAA
jgi:hypothetical protein